MFRHRTIDYLNCFLLFCVFFVIIFTDKLKLPFVASRNPTFTPRQLTTRICIKANENTLKARHKSCFLRPDTGPCRADIIQYYFDAKFSTCFRFFWGGCQGNGNRFENKADCLKYCFINRTTETGRIPHYCSLAFDFGTCFGQYNRWAWDKFSKTCRRRLYSGCGGNQNNFETKNECMATCLNPPNNTFQKFYKHTTCMPVLLDDIH